jgi:hypothetical protein
MLLRQLTAATPPIFSATLPSFDAAAYAMMMDYGDISPPTGFAATPMFSRFC